MPRATAWLPPADAAWIDTGWFAAFGDRYGVSMPLVVWVTESLK
ncbi:MAG: hypothetical protein V9E82_11040 [Candidatus Nanopelagicales bacterium]